MDAINGSINSFEQKFNKKYKYPYVFLNDKEFTKEFKEKLSKTTNNNITFGLVDPEMWNMPASIDKKRAEGEWKKMSKAGVPYSEMLSYHNMCRFFSRGFYKHPLVKDYEFYWRIEPGIRFRCDIDFDTFDYMKENNKKYGFVITIREFMASIPTLMEKTAEFLLKKYNTLFHAQNHLRFMFEERTKYNGCHFWSNFEIGSFEFLRSAVYNEYVDYLEDSGGFYYERWGDAPVHSIASALFLDKSEIHFFESIGYTHDGITHCPLSGKNCDCTQKESIDFQPYSCLKQYQNDNK